MTSRPNSMFDFENREIMQLHLCGRKLQYGIGLFRRYLCRSTRFHSKSTLINLTTNCEPLARPPCLKLCRTILTKRKVELHRPDRVGASFRRSKTTFQQCGSPVSPAFRHLLVAFLQRLRRKRSAHWIGQWGCYSEIH